MHYQLPRSNQNWIFDNFLKLSPNEDVLHRGIMGVRLERGFKCGDMERVFHGVTGRRALPTAWAAEAQRHEALAQAALKTGQTVAASQHFHRGSLYASWQHGMELLGHIWGSEESLEGMQAFLDKRKPDFQRFRQRNKDSFDHYRRGLDAGENQAPRVG